MVQTRHVGGGRHSRAMPQQTQINDWVGKMDLPQLKKLARAVFAVALKEAWKKGYLPREVVLVYDTILLH